MNHWLLKSEPDCYSIEDMKKDKRAPWTGIRNYQARNFMRDSMKVGDLAFFYHSGPEKAIVGVVKVVKEAYPDKTQFDTKDDHYDPKATTENPPWVNVDVEYKETFSRPVTLAEIKIRPDLKGIPLTKVGNRLSIQPVSEAHFKIIEKLGIKGA